MSDVNKVGGPAFPVSLPGCGDNGWHGMSLRDWFAGQVMMMTLSLSEEVKSSLDCDFKSAAESAYRFADAMLEARKREPKP